MFYASFKICTRKVLYLVRLCCNKSIISDYSGVITPSADGVEKIFIRMSFSLF